jgi:hypothetical protein
MNYEEKKRYLRNKYNMPHWAINQLSDKKLFYLIQRLDHVSDNWGKSQ